MDTIQYELNFNLQQKAALTAAISCWSKHQHQIDEFFIACDKIEGDDAKNKWERLTRRVIDDSDYHKLPAKLKSEFIYVVREVGRKILNWFKYILYENNLKNRETFCYLDKIHWTSYGTVDEIKTFQLSWMKNRHFNVTNLYKIACKYALKEDINYLWKKIPRFVKYNWKNDNCKHYERQILGYWKYIRDNDLPNLKKCFEKTPKDLILQDDYYDSLYYDDDRSPEENMLRLSIDQGNKMAARYFWEKLTEDERNQSLLTYARLAVINYINTEHEKDLFNYKNENYLEICMFLMNQMTKEQKRLFFNEPSGSLILDKLIYKQSAVKSIILRMLLHVWPWQELFMPTLNEMLNDLELDSRIIKMCLDLILDKMTDHHELGHSIQNSRHQSLFQEVWLMIPGSMKQKLIQDDPKCDCICRLLDIWDLSSIKLMINDPEIGDAKDKYLDSGHKRYRWLIMNDKYDDLDEFIEKVFKNEEEKRCFKKSINLWDSSVLDDEFHLVDAILRWEWDRPENRHYVKGVINYINLCELFIKTQRSHLAAKFLDWTCETEEERRKYREHLKNNMIDEICKKRNKEG